MPRVVTPEFLAGYVDGCGTVHLVDESDSHVDMLVLLLAHNNKVLDAVAYETQVGTVERKQLDNGVYMYSWTISTNDDIFVLFSKIHAHSVILFDVVDAFLSFYDTQKEYTAIKNHPRKDMTPKRMARAEYRLDRARKDLVRTLKRMEQQV